MTPIIIRLSELLVVNFPATIAAYQRIVSEPLQAQRLARRKQQIFLHCEEGFHTMRRGF